MVQIIKPGLISNILVSCDGLLRCENDADSEREECCTFDKRRCNQHGGSDLSGDFRLTAACFHGCRCKLADAKITWKKGDLVELIGYEASHAAKPMQFEGRAVGFVVNVDHSDDTTRVVYFDEDGERRTQWFKPVDLKSFAAVEPV